MRKFELVTQCIRRMWFR